MDSLSAFFKSKMRTQRTTGSTSRVRSFNSIANKEVSKYVSVTRSQTTDIAAKISQMQRTLDMIEQFLGPITPITDEILDEEENGRETN